MGKKKVTAEEVMVVIECVEPVFIGPFINTEENKDRHSTVVKVIIKRKNDDNKVNIQIVKVLLLGSRMIHSESERGLEYDDEQGSFNERGLEYDDEQGSFNEQLTLEPSFKPIGVIDCVNGRQTIEIEITNTDEIFGRMDVSVELKIGSVEESFSCIREKAINILKLCDNCKQNGFDSESVERKCYSCLENERLNLENENDNISYTAIENEERKVLDIVKKQSVECGCCKGYCFEVFRLLLSLLSATMVFGIAITLILCCLRYKKISKLQHPELLDVKKKAIRNEKRFFAFVVVVSCGYGISIIWEIIFRELIVKKYLDEILNLYFGNM